MSTRLVIADDHHLVRAGLTLLVNGIDGFEVVAQAADGIEALDLACQLSPDILLLDIEMPKMSGLDCLAQLPKKATGIKTLMLTMHAAHGLARRALQMGAHGYLVKGADPTELELALRTVAKGAIWVSAEAFSDVIGPRARAFCETEEEELTPRQRMVLRLLAEGTSTKEIAFELSVSVKTVETLRSQIMQRLGLRSVAALVRYAIRRGLVPL